MKRLLLLFIVFFSFSVLAQKNYDISHLSADIQIVPTKKLVSGTLFYELRTTKKVDSILIDAPGVSISKVKVNHRKRRFYTTNKYLIIKNKFKKDKIYRVTIDYKVHPNKAMYFVGWHTSGRKQVWTQGQGKDNSHWLPTNSDLNDKFTWQLSITFPRDYSVVSNGELLRINHKNATSNQYVFKQDKPAPAYLMFVGGGKYDEQIVRTSSGIKVYNYQYTDCLQNDKTFYKTRQIFDDLSTEIGVPFPWKNYKQIPLKDFLYGGMENVSATSFNGDRYVVDSIAFNDTNFVNVSAHELAHQWFGDWVTGNSSYDHWLHESFATYYARQIDEKIFGKDYNSYQIYKYDQQVVHSKDTIPLHRPNASSLTYYQKGASVVRMMREKLGKKTFDSVIHTFLRKFAYKNATTKDFKNVLYEVSGDSLHDFFNLWFETTRIPQYTVVQKNDSIIIANNSEKLPLIFQIITHDGSHLTCSKKSFKLIDAQNVISVIPNPDNLMLAKIDYKRSEKFVINQVLKAPNFIDKYKALQAMKTWNFTKKDTVFEQLINRQNYYPVYKEIIAQIKDSLNEKHIAMLQHLFRKDIKTRQQIALQISKIPKEIKNDYYSLLLDNSYLTKQMVLWHYWTNFKDEQFKILDDTQHIKGRNAYEFRMMWLTFALVTQGYQNAKKKEFLNELLNFSNPENNMLVRLTAFQTFESLQYFDTHLLDNLIDASFHFNWRMSTPARQMLKRWYQNKQYSEMIMHRIKQLDKVKRTSLINYLKKS